MAENGRLKKLDTVIAHFKTMMAAHRGEVTCQVTSAKVNLISLACITINCNPIFKIGII